jgi:acyl-[acyl-carrier-protein]-phospholipid O-acyltransferase/long-chain-fatty-acid--[acyl-carrier-protein] ligase
MLQRAPAAPASDLREGAPFDPAGTRTTLPLALLDAVAKAGRSSEALEDPERKPLDYRTLVIGAFVLGDKLKVGLERGEHVGLLLPNVNGAVVSLFALLFNGLVPVILNFTAGPKNLSSACQTARIGTIVTSRRFVDQGKLEDVVAAIGQGRRVVYLEDVRASVGAIDKLKGAAKALAARALLRGVSRPDDAAVVLFTSGSEGAPKGVVLSHANILANVLQVEQHFGTLLTGVRHVFFNPLPIFHSYGLTGGLMLALLRGHKTVLYPSPLHFKQIPKLIGETKATLLFGTDTFLMGYRRAAEPGDLAGLQVIVTGAEKVKPETRRLYAEVTAAEVLEGYGATECSPVISVNQLGPGRNRHGTVGPLLPGVRARLMPVEGIADGGRLCVTGPNVMKGYMLADRPGEVQPPADGWHDTGDIVVFDEAESIVIRGRAKRFAKIGGEMVSLAAVETLVSETWPEHSHVAVVLPDARKGEQIVLVTDRPDAERADLIAHFAAQGAPELWVPRSVLMVPAIPVLGSGKVDYPGAAALAASKRGLL